MQYKEKKYYLKCKSKNINTKLPRKNINRYKYYKQLYKQFGGVNNENQNASNDDKASMNNDLSNQIKELTNIVNSLQQNQQDIKNTINTQTVQLEKKFDEQTKQLEDIPNKILNKIADNTKYLENTFTTKLQETNKLLEYNPTEEKKHIDLLLKKEDKSVDHYRDIMCKYQLYLDHSKLWKAENNLEYQKYNELYNEYKNIIGEFNDTDEKILIKHYSLTDYNASYNVMIIRLQDYILDKLLNTYYNGLTTNIKNNLYQNITSYVTEGMQYMKSMKTSMSENMANMSNSVSENINSTSEYNDYLTMMANINTGINTDDEINTKIISLYDVIIQSKCCHDNLQYSSNKESLTKNLLLKLNSSDNKYLLKIIIIFFITSTVTQNDFISILESLKDKLLTNINENDGNVILYFALCYKLSKDFPEDHSDILKHALEVLKQNTNMHQNLKNNANTEYKIHFYQDGVKYYDENNWINLLRVYNSDNYKNEMQNEFVNFHRILFDLTSKELNLLNQDKYLEELTSKSDLEDNEIILLLAVCEKLNQKSEIINFIKTNKKFTDKFQIIHMNRYKNSTNDQYFQSATKFYIQQIKPKITD